MIDDDEGLQTSTPMSASARLRAETFGLVERHDRRWDAVLRKSVWDIVDTYRPLVVVQSVGGPLPAWVTPRDVLPEWPLAPPWAIVEVLVVPDPAFLARHLGELEANRNRYPPSRWEHWGVAIMPVDLSVSARDVAEALRVDMVIVTAPGDLDVVASSLAGIYTRPHAIGLDHADIRAAAVYTGGLGRAIILDGIVDRADAPAVERWFVAARGGKREEGGVLIIQSIGAQDVERWDPRLGLSAFDDFCSALATSLRPGCMSITLTTGGASTAAVVIAFA